MESGDATQADVRLIDAEVLGAALIPTAAIAFHRYGCEVYSDHVDYYFDGDLVDPERGAP